MFEATKLVIETQYGAKGLEVDQTAKPNQTSLALCLRFLSPSHYHQMFTKGRFLYTEIF